MLSTPIKNIHGFISYVQNHSRWKSTTIHNVVLAMGFSISGGIESLKKLSSYLSDCAKYGANNGFPGFIYYEDTIAFFCQNRKDIVANIEQTAAEMGEDIIKMVQSFGVFRNTATPTSDNIGNAIWDSAHCRDELSTLYNVFAWFVLEEISRIWLDYLEANPAYDAELSA